MDKVSSAALSSCGDAVKLTIYLAGSMALWGGLMKICSESGLSDKIKHLLKPIIKLLFKSTDGKAEDAISMNITSNLLGLGNAATPLGITAAKEIVRQPESIQKRNLATLVVLNTASIQLIPSTIAAMRLEHGSGSPFDITIPIIFCSLISVFMGILTVRLLTPIKKHI